MQDCELHSGVCNLKVIVWLSENLSINYPERPKE
ncbi:hypothetical protein EH197_23610 [Enterococcus avium]|nr:hypothetical protein EH197_23610 [Enterococcus avium]